MNPRSRQDRRDSRGHRGPQWTKQKVIATIAIILLASLYVLARPTLERWTGLTLPTLTTEATDPPATRSSSPQRPKQSSSSQQKRASNDSSFLTEIGRNRFRSPEGLVYTQGPGGEHRIQHIMRHAQDDEEREIHGVFFLTEQDELLALLDEAYRLIRANSNRVQREIEDDRVDYLVDMQKPIGYVGGKSGQRQNHPQCQGIKLILEDDRVITAYPYLLRRSR